MQIWAHRGASAYAPENTIGAFQKAIDLQADGLELDVQLSLDGKVVVIHDETLQRVSNGNGYVKDYTLAELKMLSFNKVMPEYGEAVIPTLREVLQLLRNTDMQLNIELKTGCFFYPGIEEKTIQLVEQYGMQDRVWYSSFNHYTLRRIKELRPNARCGLLYTDGIYQPAGYAKWLQMEALHPSVNNLQYPDLQMECEKNGILLHPWTANNVADMVNCVDKHVDAMITNYPDRARLLIKERPCGHMLYDNPFQTMKDKTYYLFGAGYYGQQFLKRFIAKQCPASIVDNGEAKWGSNLSGVLVESPEILDKDSTVIIASIYFSEIIKQLKEIGVKDYYVFDLALDWR